ncbi:PREDICTED: alpha-sarcoglycan [Nanorana parkeri]|uniref:alpha-sarcoglycan n=1 Tax=Nanorana parkeri TaxID=125878 RepID=UPI000854AF8F|nr:PREDICTED: alpha-sarcoglycan [Nanorana parkeri]
MASGRVALITEFIWLCLVGSLCDQNVYPKVGTLFVHKLDAEDYQQQFLNKSGNERTQPISFRANLEGFPDLPGWLRYTQRSPWHSGYLYGSPTSPEKHIIEIKVYNRHTFEMLREKIVFHIRSADDVPPPYRAEFLVENMDVEEMLPPEAQHSFQVPLQAIWNTQRLSIINITSALDKGGRVPLPLPGRKEGVFIKVGSVIPFSECMYDTQNLQTRQQCQQGQKPVLCQELLPNDFVIDWCNVTLVSSRSSPIPLQTPPTAAITLDFEGDFNPPPDTLEETNYIPDYLLTFLLPTLIALLLCALLSYIMCCRREGVEKRDDNTAELQLVHQQSIFSNTEELRKMAASRDFPRPLSTLPMFNACTGEGTSPMDLAGDSARVPLILAQQ